MASWPRAILPQAVSPFLMPGALAAWSDTGKPQHRATGQLGRIWSETYPPFEAGSVAGRALLAFINNHWRNGLTFDIEHRMHLTPLGGGSGTVTVNGASQTGTSLVTAGWAGTNPVLRAGDLVQIAGIGHVFDMTEDINRSGSAATLKLNPPIFAGGSPAHGAAVTYVGPRLNAKIYEPPNLPAAGPDTYIAGLTIVFREAP